jgi:transposase
MGAEFFLNDDQWSAIAPLLLKNQPGAHRVDDRRVISGIVHVLRVGCLWQDTPAAYGPSTTIYNRFHRWSQRGIWQGLFQLNESGAYPPGCGGISPKDRG